MPLYPYTAFEFAACQANHCQANIHYSLISSNFSCKFYTLDLLTANFSSNFPLLVSPASYYSYNRFSSINPLYPFSILSPISLLLNFNSLIFCFVFNIFSLISTTLQSCSVVFPLPTADILLYKSSDSPLSLQINAQLFSISRWRISLLRSLLLICRDFFKGFVLELTFKFLSNSVYQLLRALSSLTMYCCSCSMAGVESSRQPVFRVIHSQRCRQVVYYMMGLLALFEGNCSFGSSRYELSRAVLERLISRDVILFEIIYFKCNRIHLQGQITINGVCWESNESSNNDYVLIHSRKYRIKSKRISGFSAWFHQHKGSLMLLAILCVFLKTSRQFQLGSLIVTSASDRRQDPAGLPPHLWEA